MSDGEALRLGNAPCSWGTIEGQGAAPIGYVQMLDELLASGYRGTELGDYGFMPTDPAALRRELSSRGLTMLGAYEGVALADPSAHAQGEARALRTARLLAAVADVGDPAWRPFLVLADEHSRDPKRLLLAGRLPPEPMLDEAGWRTFAGAAERIATAVREETGLATVFHPHCAGYVETPDEIAAFLERTDPERLGLVFDTGHYLYGSGRSDPEVVLQGLDRFSERIRYVHFKDMDPAVAARARSEGLNYTEAVREGIFCELGRGAVPFPEVVAWLRARRYEGWITVEQDVLPGMGAPRESAERNRAYLATLGL